MAENPTVENIAGSPTDKSEWPPGPWHTEPDRVEFEVHGFPCLLRRGPCGAWCGYVATPPGHPWHGKHYNALDVKVHGGLTYAEACDGGEICHIPQPGEPDNVWWVGFDCAHACDLLPAYYDFGLEPIRRAVYRDQAYATREIIRLVAQAREAGRV